MQAKPPRQPQPKRAVQKRSYWRELSRAKWVILGITGVTFAMSWAGLFDHLETAGLDVFNILQSPADPKHVVIVAIDDEDYRSSFHETSPLDSTKLQKLVTDIARGHPKVIGVDIDTSGDDFKALKTLPEWPGIVWARDAIQDEKSRIFKMLPVLGGRDPARNTDSTAMAILPLDSDGVIRRYHREFELGKGQRSDSFPWAVVKTACTGPLPMEGCKEVERESERAEHGFRMNFAGQRFNFSPLSARFVGQVAVTAGWANSSPLREKIVLLGGTFHAARDTRITPVGPMAGVQLMAQAIETEFSGGGVRPLNEFVAAILDLCSGALLVYIGYRFDHHLGKALLLSVGVLVIVPLVSSFLAFSTLARWFNFIPMIVGVLLHELYEHGREYQRLREFHLHEL